MDENEIESFVGEIESSDDGTIIGISEEEIELPEEEIIEEEESQEEEQEETENETEEESSTEETETETETKETQEESSNSFTYNVDGVDIEISSMEEAQQVIENMNTIPQSIDNWETIQKDLGLSLDDLSIISEIKKGNPEALAKIAKDAGISLEDLAFKEDVKDFVPNYKLPQFSEQDVFIKQLESNPKDFQDFTETLDMTDDSFVKGLASNVANLKQFQKHVKSGLAKKIIPAAKKKALLENKDMFQAYIEVGRELANSDKPKTEIKDTSKKKDINANKGKGSNTKTVERELTVEDIENMDEDEFNKRFGGTTI